MPCLGMPRFQTRCWVMVAFGLCPKLIYDKITYTYCVINEFNPTFETQNMGNEAFKNASFGNASLGNGNEDYSCLWANTILEIFYLFCPTSV